MTTVTMDLKFDQLASDEQIAATQQALNAHNIQTVVVDTGEEARDCVLGLIPEGAEVHTAMSTTLDLIGVTREIEESGRYNAIRPQLRKMDRIKQNREWRKLASAPDVMLGSVHAVTEQGQVLVASGGGSQIGPYASGAGIGHLGGRRAEARADAGRWAAAHRGIRAAAGKRADAQNDRARLAGEPDPDRPGITPAQPVQDDHRQGKPGVLGPDSKE